MEIKNSIENDSIWPICQNYYSIFANHWFNNIPLNIFYLLQQVLCVRYLLFALKTEFWLTQSAEIGGEYREKGGKWWKISSGPPEWLWMLKGDNYAVFTQWASLVQCAIAIWDLIAESARIGAWSIGDIQTRWVPLWFEIDFSVSWLFVDVNTSCIHLWYYSVGVISFTLRSRNLTLDYHSLHSQSTQIIMAALAPKRI